LEAYNLVEILQKFREDRKQFLIDKLNFIIQQLTSNEVSRLEIKKNRKQATYGSRINNKKYILTYELTELTIQNEKWFTMCAEGLSKIAVEYIAQKYSKEKNLFIMGYPQFLIEKTSGFIK
jgi:hypothetical protein